MRTHYFIAGLLTKSYPKSAGDSSYLILVDKDCNCVLKYLGVLYENNTFKHGFNKNSVYFKIVRAIFGLRSVEKTTYLNASPLWFIGNYITFSKDFVKTPKGCEFKIKKLSLAFKLLFNNPNINRIWLHYSLENIVEGKL